MKFDYPDGATPIDEDEFVDLIPKHITLHGNGRHSRLAADLLLRSMNAKMFSWGTANLYTKVEARTKYITALKEADMGNYTPLMQFVRS